MKVKRSGLSSSLADDSGTSETVSETKRMFFSGSLADERCAHRTGVELARKQHKRGVSDGKKAASANRSLLAARASR